MSQSQSESMKKEWVRRKAEGYTPWNKGKKLGANPVHSERMKGKIPWNKGIKMGYAGHAKPHSIEAKLKMSNSHKNISDETREKMRISQTGKVGPLANNWRGGVTPLYAQIRGHFKMRQWRSDVFTRDKFTCLECGDNKGGNLNADHIIPFIAILKIFKISSLEEALNCAKLWDINNGQTLCVLCHRKTPTYGNNAKTFELNSLE